MKNYNINGEFFEQYRIPMLGTVNCQHYLFCAAINNTEYIYLIQNTFIYLFNFLPIAAEFSRRTEQKFLPDNSNTDL